jgi:hypothetical protein
VCSIIIYRMFWGGGDREGRELGGSGCILLENCTISEAASDGF